jgi:hypothetical protein
MAHLLQFIRVPPMDESGWVIPAGQGEVMKNVAKSILVLTVVALCAVAVQAQTLKASVPFSFSVADSHLNGGAYVIKNISDRFIVVQDENGKETVMAMTIRKESADPVEPKLVFHRYGDQYVLAEIWNGSGRELSKTAREKELAKNGRPEILAVLLKPAR